MVEVLDVPLCALRHKRQFCYSERVHVPTLSVLAEVEVDRILVELPFDVDPE